MTRRIQLIDAVRGLCVVLMVLHHLIYDLVVLLSAPEWLYTNPLIDILHYIFAGTFILLSGISSRFSHSNVKRGLKVVAAALAISLVTYFMDSPIYFGILHLLGFSMLFYGLTSKFWDRFTSHAMPVCCALLTAAGAVLAATINPVETGHLWALGFWTASFFSADYFPIIPWIFVFMLGTWLGRPIRDGKFPGWFYSVSPPLLPRIGRKAFIVYLLHQPVLYSAVYCIKVLSGR